MGLAGARLFPPIALLQDFYGAGGGGVHLLWSHPLWCWYQSLWYSTTEGITGLAWSLYCLCFWPEETLLCTLWWANRPMLLLSLLWGCTLAWEGLLLDLVPASVQPRSFSPQQQICSCHFLTLHFTKRFLDFFFWISHYHHSIYCFPVRDTLFWFNKWFKFIFLVPSTNPPVCQHLL